MQTQSTGSAALCVTSSLMSRACVLALATARCCGFKLILLKALQGIDAIRRLKRSVWRRDRAKHKKYSSYTKRFDRTLLATKTDCANLQSDCSMLAPGYIEIIDRKRLHQIIVDLTQATKRTACSKLCKPARALNFIIDKSASMIGKQRKTARLMDAILTQTALDYEVNGYTTRCWHNSNAFKLWSRAKSSSPGRVNDTLYIKYGSGRRSLKLACLNSLNKENVDGEAVSTLAKNTHVNIIINDNAPADYVTNRLNAQNILTENWRIECANALARGIDLLIINLGRRRLPERACVNLSGHLDKRKLNGIIKTVLKLSAR
ncbi:MAG: Aerobic cobaltochelatase subunit CobT [Candidatus Hodgkinia cicadicola]|nr:MAG: Aerobic cobaltochelatase subunit CobT [Candidatus Hodgkinia cicadicola]